MYMFNIIVYQVLFECVVCIVRWTLELTLLENSVSMKLDNRDEAALSTAEAEYMALAIATQEAIWIRRLSTDLNSIPTKPTVLYEDNHSSISMAKNPKFHGRCKHIGIKYPL